MKLDASKLRAGQTGSLDIKITAQTDYPILGPLIQPGDEIESTIRVKDTAAAGGRKSATMSFVSAVVTVEKVVYDAGSINVNGPFRTSDGRKRGRTNMWLIDGIAFTLRKKSWKREEVQALQPKTGRAPSGQASPTNAAVSGRAMLELQELLATDPGLLVFGKEQTLFVLDHGAVKTALLTEGAFAKLSREKQAQLGNPTSKFRGAEVVRVEPASEYHSVIQAFGGIVAILKYRFNPDDCM
jgi:stalled ribosome rescue protein Dom34